MRIKSILEDEKIKKEAENVKTIILSNENEYSWMDLRQNHGFDLDALHEIVSEMMNVGELYEPVLGVLSVVKP